MKKLIVAAAAIAGLAAFGTASAAGDLAAGKAKAQAVCIACHGPQGISNNPEWPNLRGQKAQYIIKQLKAFKAGTRSNPLMTPQAKLLSDQDIENVAAYWSSLPLCNK